MSVRKNFSFNGRVVDITHGLKREVVYTRISQFCIIVNEISPCRQESCLKIKDYKKNVMVLLIQEVLMSQGIPDTTKDQKIRE